jgi:hypothetical protein
MAALLTHLDADSQAAAGPALHEAKPRAKLLDWLRLPGSPRPSTSDDAAAARRTPEPEPGLAAVVALEKSVAVALQQLQSVRDLPGLLTVEVQVRPLTPPHYSGSPHRGCCGPTAAAVRLGQHSA